MGQIKPPKWARYSCQTQQVYTSDFTLDKKRKRPVFSPMRIGVNMSTMGMSWASRFLVCALSFFALHAADISVSTESQHIAAQVRRLPPGSEVWVPGGMKALAGFAEMSKTGAYQDFFREFCQTLVRENSPGVARGIPNYGDLRTYMASIAELAV